MATKSASAEVRARDRDEAEHDGRRLRDLAAVGPLYALQLGPAGAQARRFAAATARSRLALRGASWAELQRVQWPDRRQVTQATAVVLGFVAIAGAYLGLADFVAKEIVEFIL